MKDLHHCSILMVKEEGWSGWRRISVVDADDGAEVKKSMLACQPEYGTRNE